MSGEQKQSLSSLQVPHTGRPVTDTVMATIAPATVNSCRSSARRVVDLSASFLIVFFILSSSGISPGRVCSTATILEQAP